MEFIHYGSEHFSKKMFKEPVYDGDRVRCLNKPSKGFWGSPVNAKHSWRDFCLSEEFDVSSLDKHFKFKIKESARVLKVLNIKDLFSLYRKYGVIGEYGRRALNWKKIVKEYDAMLLLIPDDFDLLYRLNLTSWDVDSIVVFNPDIVEEIKVKAR